MAGSAVDDRRDDDPIQESVRTALDSEYGRFKEHSLAWLAITPEWTESLALQCRLFSSPEDFSEFRPLAEATGTCQFSEVKRETESLLWRRAQLFGELLRRAPGAWPRAVVEEILCLDNQHIRAEAWGAAGAGIPAGIFAAYRDRIMADVEALPDSVQRFRALTDLAPLQPRPSEFLDHLFDQILEIVPLADRVEVLSAVPQAFATLSGKRQRQVIEGLLADRTGTASNALLRLWPYFESRDELLPSLRAVLGLSGWKASGDTWPDDELFNLAPHILASLGMLLADQPLAPFVDRLIHRLAESQGAAQRTYSMALAGLKGIAAAPLEESLDGVPSAIRPLIVQVLGMVADRTMEGRLRRRVGDLDPEVRRRVIEILKRVGDLETTPTLVARLRDENLSVRLAAVEVVGEVGDLQAIPSLRELLSDHEDPIRQAAIKSLTMLVMRESAGDEDLESHFTDAMPSRSLASSRRSTAPSPPDGEKDDDFLVSHVIMLQSRADRAICFARLAHRSGGERFWRDIDDSLADISSEADRATVMVQLANCLPQRLIPNLLKQVAKVTEAELRAEILQAALDRLPDEGFEVALGLARDLSPELRFWMPTAARSSVVSYFQRNKVDLREHLRDAASAVTKADQVGNAIPSPLRRWLELAELALQRSDATRWLQRRVQQLADAGETVEARALIGAAEMLAQVLGGEMRDAALLGNRQLELVFRRVRDERHLRHYFLREDQITPFRNLLKQGEASDEVWALHYLGMGGVGKTMLLRHLMARVAPECNAIAARIDFDHISPEFPTRRPGLLLAELAEDLRLQATAFQMERSFDKFRDTVVAYHERIDRETARPLDLLDYIRADRYRFHVVLDGFATLLRQLRPKQVVLMLDTTEELAKVHSLGAHRPNIDATFAILEALWARYRSLRVVFAGRRPLALSGHGGWTVAESGHAHLAPEKRYLRLQEIRAFARNDADAYLRDVRHLKLANDLRDAILGRSPEAGRCARIVWPSSRASDGETTRYNPFDLNLYASWAEEDPTLNASVINAGDSDPYVEIRIVNRIHSTVLERLLPAAILLRRFDIDLLRLAVASQTDSVEEIFRALAEQEWTDCQRDDNLNSTFVEIDRQLLPRLEKYYGHSTRRQMIDDMRQRIGAGLQTIIHTRPLGQLRFDHFDAALRILPAADASRLWEAVERRVAAESTWDVLLNSTDRLLASGNPLSESHHPLRAAVLATHAAANARVHPDMDRRSLWRDVAISARFHPDSAARPWLRRRALAGELAAIPRQVGVNPPEKLLRRFEALLVSFSARDHNKPPLSIPGDSETFHHQQNRGRILAFACCAGLQNLVDIAEYTGRSELLPKHRSLERFILGLQHWPALSKALAHAYCLHARRAYLSREPVDRVQSAFGLARKACEDLTASAACEIDWSIPEPLAELVKLESLRCHDSGLAEWNPPAPAGSGICRDRLDSCLVLRHLDHAILTPQQLEEFSQHDRYLGPERPKTLAEAVTPPLVCSLALGWLASGQVTRAIGILESRAQEAAERSDAELQREISRTKVAVARRLRWHSRAMLLATTLSRNLNPFDLVHVWPLMALTGQRIPDEPPNLNSPAILHAWWQSQVLWDSDATQQAIATFVTGVKRLTTSQSAMPESSLIPLLVDFREIELLSRRFGLPIPEAPFSTSSTTRERFAAQRATSEAELRIDLRQYALESSPDPQLSAQLIDAAPLGQRRRGEVALEEGELLALRLPSHAVRLLTLAASVPNSEPAIVFPAAVCQTFAHLRAGAGELARVEIKQRVEPAYEEWRRLKESDLDDKTSRLPDWTTLVDWAGNYGDSTFPAEWQARFQDSPWEGWMRRLLGCIAWIEHPLMNDEQRTKWQQFASYGSEFHSPELDFRAALIPIPAELSLSPWSRFVGQSTMIVAALLSLMTLLAAIAMTWFGGSGLVFTALLIANFFTIGVGADRWKALSARMRRLEDLVAIGTAISFLWALGYGGHALVYRGLVRVAPEQAPQSVGLFLACLAGVIMLGGAFVWIKFQFERQSKTFRDRIAAWMIREPFLRLSIRNARDSAGAPPDLFAETSTAELNYEVAPYLRVRRYLVESRYLLEFNQLLSLFVSNEVPISAVYRELFPLHVAPRVFRLLITYGSHPRAAATGQLAVIARGSYAAAARACEVLQMARPRRPLFPIAISLSVVPGQQFQPWEALVAMSLFPTHDDHLRMFALSIWRESERLPAANVEGLSVHDIAFLGDPNWQWLVKDGWRSLSSSVVVVEDRKMNVKAGSVWHLLGRPVTTTDNVFLGVGDHAESRGGGDLISAYQLPADQAAIVVVQGVPTSPTPRSDSERIETASLRSFAASLFEAGARYVIMIPSLPPPMAEGVLRELAETLQSDWSHAAFPLLDSIRRIRIRIGTAKLPNSFSSEEVLAWCRETAMDVTLFASWPKLPTAETSDSRLLAEEPMDS